MPVESLIWLRADPARWAHLDYVPTVDDGGLPDDANRAARAVVLEMLAHDHTPDDADFLRHLLRQETAMHEAAWGYGDSLGLAALLLSGCGVVDDVWLLWRAKTANFDTLPGLDLEVLFGAGVAETLAFVRVSQHPDRDELLRYLEDGVPAEEEVRDRLAGLRAYHGI